MPFKIVRNDIIKMNTDAIVNTANTHAAVGPGCDSAVYNAAGYEELLKYRTEKIGSMDEGEAFLTPGFNLRAKYIIHAVSPHYLGGSHGEEEKLRSCYRKSLQIAKENNIRSIAFPLISTGGFEYPKEEGMRIAVDEINAFLLSNDMLIYLVVFDQRSTMLGEKIHSDLEAYIDHNYVSTKWDEEYGNKLYGNREYGNQSFSPVMPRGAGEGVCLSSAAPEERRPRRNTETQKKVRRDFESGALQTPKKASWNVFKPSSTGSIFRKKDAEPTVPTFRKKDTEPTVPIFRKKDTEPTVPVKDERLEKDSIRECNEAPLCDFVEQHESRLEERMKHISDTFSQYLMYLIEDKKMENAEVYKRAIVDKKVFSKIKNNVDYHPQKLTALCLCVGAKLNLDESKDLLARAGYALSPCDKTDIIFSYFIENEIYDMIELDIQLEEHGLPCIIS